METIRQKKVFLIDTLRADHSFILQYVHQEKIITEREYSNLNHSTHTHEQIIINLLDTVMGKGNESCCRFVDLLQQEDIQECYPNLEQLSHPKSPSKGVPVQESNEEGDCYPITHRPVGYCLIINNYLFDKTSPFGNRHGTDSDKDALTDIFHRMHFLVEERRDLRSSDVLNVVKEFAEKDHYNMDVFVCCILSHGAKGIVFGIDGKPGHIPDLTQLFAHCRSLTGKPKLFFIQANQYGEFLHQGKSVRNPLQEGVWVYEDDSEKADVRCIPIEADILIGMATVESYQVFRHTTKGSIYIQELCRQLRIGCPKKEDILSILTKVNYNVSVENLNGSKQMPQPRYTLTKKLVLPMD